MKAIVFVLSTLRFQNPEFMRLCCLVLDDNIFLFLGDKYFRDAYLVSFMWSLWRKHFQSFKWGIWIVNEAAPLYNTGSVGASLWQCWGVPGSRYISCWQIRCGALCQCWQQLPVEQRGHDSGHFTGVCWVFFFPSLCFCSVLGGSTQSHFLAVPGDELVASGMPGRCSTTEWHSWASSCINLK